MIKTGRLHIGAALILACLLFSCTEKEPEEPGKFNSSERGYAIDFPENWELDKEVMELDVIAFSPLESSKDSFRDNISAASTLLRKPLDSEEVLDANIEGMMNVITDFEPVERTKKQIGEHEAAVLVYNQRQGMHNLTSALYAISTEERAYLIFCTAEKKKFDNFRDKCENIVSTFRVLR